MQNIQCCRIRACPFSTAPVQVKIVAAGAAYTSFEGYKDEATGETVVGLSYDKLCQHVKPGGRILVADGSLAIKVGGGAAAGPGERAAPCRGGAPAALLRGWRTKPCSKAGPADRVSQPHKQPAMACMRQTPYTRLPPTRPQVDSILSDTELVGTALNGKSLGERKNCNLPGVLVDLPVLGEKDIDDVQNFACK